MKKILKLLAIVYLVFSAIVVTPWAYDIAVFKLNDGDRVVGQLAKGGFTLSIGNIGYNFLDPYTFEKIPKSLSNKFIGAKALSSNEDLFFEYFFGRDAKKSAKNYYEGNLKFYPPEDYPEFNRVLTSNQNWAIFVHGGSDFSKTSQNFFRTEFNPKEKLFFRNLEFSVYRNNGVFYLRNLFVERPDFFLFIWLRDIIYFFCLPVLIPLNIIAFLLAYLPASNILMWLAAIILPIAAILYLFFVVGKFLTRFRKK